MQWGSESWKSVRDAQLMEWFNNDEHAVHFLLSISTITELWDDLIDKDKQLTDAMIHKGFFEALVSLPCNPFYIKHRVYLTPIIIQAINSWQDANVLQTGSRNDRAIAYTLRNMDIQLVQAIVYITQGYDKLREVSPEIWRYFGSEQDDIITWACGDTT